MSLLKQVLTVAAFLCVTGLFANSVHEDFTNTTLSESSSSLVMKYSGVDFLIKFTNKGDGGQFYTSPTDGFNVSNALVATSTSVGSMDPEEVVIQRVDGKAFLFNSLYVHANGEPVTIVGYFDDEAAISKTLTQQDGGQFVKGGKKVTSIVLRSYDMMAVVIDELDFELNELETKKSELPVATAKSAPTKIDRSMVSSVAPEFHKQLWLAEGTRNGSVVCSFNIPVDQPLASWKVIGNSDQPSVFEISESNQLRVENNVTLDCKQQNGLPLDVALMVNSKVTYIIHLDIELVEVDNEMPLVVANQQCSAEVLSGGNGFALCQINAADSDTELRRLEKWRIEDSNLAEIFGINADGELQIKTLDHPSIANGRNVFQVPISVSDGHQRGQVATVKVVINKLAPEKKSTPKIIAWPLTETKEEVAPVVDSEEQGNKAVLARIQRKGMPKITVVKTSIMDEKLVSKAAENQQQVAGLNWEVLEGMPLF